MIKPSTRRLALSFETIRNLDAVTGGAHLASSAKQPNPTIQDTVAHIASSKKPFVPGFDPAKVRPL